MSFKFDPNAANERKYITKAGLYDLTVRSFTKDYMEPRADFYLRFTLVNDQDEIVFGDLFKKPEKSGTHERINQFVASTASADEINEYLAMGECDMTEDFMEKFANRAVGRRVRVVVTEKKFMRKNGEEGVAYQGSFFRRHPDGPVLPF
jgi:hypothetical protein